MSSHSFYQLSSESKSAAEKSWYHLIRPNWRNQRDKIIGKEPREHLVTAGPSYYQKSNNVLRGSQDLAKTHLLLTLAPGSLEFIFVLAGKLALSDVSLNAS